MKKIAGLVLVFFLTGCSFGVQDMGSLVRDPHYAQYQQSLDNLEHEYLQKQISYTEYQDKKKELEDNYVKEVKIREGKIHE